MHKKGHYGAALTAYAPVGMGALTLGFDVAAVGGGLVAVGLAMLPDVDMNLPTVAHRGQFQAQRRYRHTPVCEASAQLRLILAVESPRCSSGHRSIPTPSLISGNPLTTLVEHLVEQLPLCGPEVLCHRRSGDTESFGQLGRAHLTRALEVAPDVRVVEDRLLFLRKRLER